MESNVIKNNKEQEQAYRNGLEDIERTISNKVFARVAQLINQYGKNDSLYVNNKKFIDTMKDESEKEFSETIPDYISLETKKRLMQMHVLEILLNENISSVKDISQSEINSAALVDKGISIGFPAEAEEGDIVFTLCNR